MRTQCWGISAAEELSGWDLPPQWSGGPHLPLSNYHRARTTTFPISMSIAHFSPISENPYCALWNLRRINSKSLLFSSISPNIPLTSLLLQKYVVPWGCHFLIWWLFLFFSSMTLVPKCDLGSSWPHSEAHAIRFYLPLAFIFPVTSDPLAMLPYLRILLQLSFSNTITIWIISDFNILIDIHDPSTILTS